MVEHDFNCQKRLDYVSIDMSISMRTQSFQSRVYTVAERAVDRIFVLEICLNVLNKSLYYVSIGLTRFVGQRHIRSKKTHLPLNIELSPV